MFRAEFTGKILRETIPHELVFNNRPEDAGSGVLLGTSLTPLPMCGNRPLHSDCAKRSDLKLTVWHSDSRHPDCLDPNSDIIPSAGSPHSNYALSPTRVSSRFSVWK